MSTFLMLIVCIMALLYEINSVNSLVQVYPSLLQASDQVLVVAASSILCVLSWRPSLDVQRYNPEGSCVSPPTKW